MFRCLPSVWKLDRKDFILFFFSSLVRFLVIFTIDPEIFSKNKSYTNYKFLFYQDSIISLHSAKRSFKDSYKLLSPESFFCNPLQLHGKFVRIFINIFFKLFLFLDKNNSIENKSMLGQIKVKSTIYGQVTSIFISSFIACYAFRRLLSIFQICDYKIQKNDQSKKFISTSPFLLTILFTVLPFRFSFLQSCATSDSLFFSFVCFSFIFFNASNLISTFLFMITFFAALMTRYEGIVLIPIFTIIIICKLIMFIYRKNKQTNNDENNKNSSASSNENKNNSKNEKINENNNNKDDKINEKNENNNVKDDKINEKNENNNDDNKDDKIKEDNDKVNANNSMEANKEEYLYDDNSSMLLISLILKLIFIIISSIFYYYLFKNYGDRPFTLKNYFIHLIFPYQFPNEVTKNDKKNKNALIAYPFYALLAQAGAINTLRQAHSSFSLFFPLLFAGILLVTTKSEEVETKSNLKEIQSKKQSENQQKTKPVIKEEKSQPKQKPKQKSNHNKFKNNQNASKKNSSSNQNQTKITDEEPIKTQNQEEDSSITHSSFSPFYQKVTADFMRQIGILVLFFTILASCISTPASFRFLVTAQAFAYPIVVERLINHFLQLLFSTTNFINSENDINEVDKMKNLKGVAVSEKIVFVCGSLILLTALVAWDCFYSRRESHRITFTDLWYKLASK